MSDYVVCDIRSVETPWRAKRYAEMIFTRGDFKLPTPYPDLDGRDFPWAPKVSYKELRSGRSYPQFYTGSYGTSGSWDGHKWVPKETRLYGTQCYTNGDQFTGFFRNLGGAPSEGTYTFANGNTLKGIFRDWQRGTHSIILKQHNSISSGTFYNKTHGVSYTGQWTTSPSGETTLSGYILVEDIYGLPFIVYYRDGHPYQDVIKWSKSTGKCVDYSVEWSLMYDPQLHPDSREALWTTNFKKHLDTVLMIDAEAEDAAGIGIVDYSDDSDIDESSE